MSTSLADNAVPGSTAAVQQDGRRRRARQLPARPVRRRALGGVRRRRQPVDQLPGGRDAGGHRGRRFRGRRAGRRRRRPAGLRPGDWAGLPETASGATSCSASPTCCSRDKDSYARAEALDTGKRLVEAEYDIDDIVSCFRYYGGIAGTDAGRVVDTGNPNAISRIVYAPVGVCSLITPWNYPLLQVSWKVAPALLAGNTFVLKPSELTPSTAILLMDTLAEAGVPAGVANLVTGSGPEVGVVLTTDPRVDMVSFTGGLATGQGDHGGRRGNGEEGGAGARRQEPQHRLRRRRPRGRHRLRPDRGVPAFRPGVLGRRPADRRSASCTTGSSTRSSPAPATIRLGGPFDADAETAR